MSFDGPPEAVEIATELAQGLFGGVETAQEAVDELADANFEETFHNLINARRFAFDVGTELVKIAYSSVVERCITTLDGKVQKTDKRDVRLHCIQFLLRSFPKILDYIASNCTPLEVNRVAVSTASNCRHYEQLIADRLGVQVVRVAEMDGLVRGTNFLLRNLLDEVFEYDHHNPECRYLFQTVSPSSHFPYELVNVGTGAAIYQVTSPDSYERLGGSLLGGGAFFGISHLLSQCDDLDQMMQMAEDGDHRHIDKLVCDIYGGHYQTLGLPGDLIAGSFGKSRDRETADALISNDYFTKDAVRSLLLMLSNSIGQMSVLYAQRANLKTIVFGGYLVRNHPIIMRTLSYAVHFWSQGTMRALFLRHEAYAAALGAFIRAVVTATHDDAMNHELEVCSWREHYAGCSDLGRFVPKQPLSAGFQASILEMDSAGMTLSPLPLLSDDASYVPDTVDLNKDEEARNFWINIMRSSVDKMLSKAMESQAGCKDASQRAGLIRDKFLHQLDVIHSKSFAYGSCNVRNLLDLREQVLNEHQFDDAYKRQKWLENNAALDQLRDVCSRLDAISDPLRRLEETSRGLLAGNVFDWGAHEVVRLMERASGLDFDEALRTIPQRPWLEDGFDEFSKRALMRGNPYKTALVFVDNSGADFCLGVLPFARELLRIGTRVIIGSNTSPALNDLTFAEMEDVCSRFVNHDTLLAEALKDGRLMLRQSGQGSPCLDLRRVNSELNALCVAEGVDLVVIEGMGRALHTNYEAKLKCDTLKAAVVKTRWLADRLGGQIFSVIFRFEKGTDCSSSSSSKCADDS